MWSDMKYVADAHFSVPASTEPPGEIVVTCPNTLTAVATGLKTQWVVFRSLPPIQMPLRCPACGHTHKWKPQDAWIAVDKRLVAISTNPPSKAGTLPGTRR